MRLTKNAKNVLTLTVLAIALYAAGSLLVEKTFVPQNFTEARATSAKTAGELMTILATSQENLGKISELHQKGQFPAALALVQSELENGKLSLAKSQQLAAELNDMSNTATAITPTKARNLAVEAMRSEVELMGELIIYNQSFNALLTNLQLKFSGAITTDNSAEIQKQIELMNLTGKEINGLNETFNQKMAEFDRLTSK